MSHFSCLKLIPSQYPGASSPSPCFSLHPAGIYWWPKNRWQEMSLAHTGTRCILFFLFFSPLLLSFDLSSYCNQPSITKAWRTSTQGPLCVWFLQEHLPHSVCCLSQSSKLKFNSNKSAAHTLIKTVISFYLLHQLAQSPTTLPHLFSAALSLVVAACWTAVCLQLSTIQSKINYKQYTMVSKN